MKKNALTILQLIIILFITGLLITLIYDVNSNKNKISENKSQENVSLETVNPNLNKQPQKETKILPSNIEEAFPDQDSDFNMDFVSKDRIPKLKIKKENTESAYCGKDNQELVNKLGAITGSESFKESCKTDKTFYVDGYLYTCTLGTYPVILTTSVQIEGSEKAEGKALDLLNCDKKGYFELNGKKFSCPIQLKGIAYEECLKIKDNLGIKECFDSSIFPFGDKWVAAAKQCGGVKNLPTMEELAEISSVVFEGSPSLKPYEYKIVKHKQGLGKYTELWSNEELGSGACGRHMNLIYTQDFILSRGIDITTYTICKLK